MIGNSGVKECDLLIIGGGGAGALAAVEASRHEKLRIVLVSRGPVGRSGLTPTANGGTAFHSTAEETVKEMLTAGCFLNDQKLVGVMAEEALGILERLRGFGIESVPIRAVSRCILPSHLLPTLRKMMFRSANVELLEDVLITRLLTRGGSIAGATALNLATGEFFPLKAKAVVLATGGLVGEMYPYTSNNPFGVSTDSSGAGHAMAYQAGAELIDLEMIQFVPVPCHPRCLNLRYYPDFLEGPYLNRHGDIVEDNVNAYQGKSYDYHFVQKFWREIEKGNGPLFVDQRGLPRKHTAHKVKSWNLRRKLIGNLGIDPHENRMEIVVGSHFGMGGVKVDEKLETTVPGLFAAGEVMGGVHGGLRLAGFSFTQMIVFGFLAGRHAAGHALVQKSSSDLDRGEIEEERARVFGFLAPRRDGCSLQEIKRRLQGIMAEHVFVFRNREGLGRAVQGLESLRREVSSISVPVFKQFNLDWARAIEFDWTARIAEVIARSALLRQESRGFHFRTDFPQRSDAEWLKHTVARREGERTSLSTRPVSLPYLQPEA